MPSGVRGLDLMQILTPDRMANEIARQYQEWEIFRQTWLNQKMELRNYLFSTDTSTTSVSGLPWKNSTTVPKLTQLRDNLHANYMAALFPNDRPIEWEGDDEDSEAKQKREAIESYIENKMRLSKFRTEISKIVSDYIDYGNCFGTVAFVNQTTEDPVSKEIIQGYVGPRLERISPLDITFNPTAPSFDESAKIVRSLKTLSTLKADIDDHPEQGYLSEAMTNLVANRQKFTGLSMGDFAKSQAYQIDGFANYLMYFQSQYVEILDFYGDIYDPGTDLGEGGHGGKWYKNYLISVADRSRIIRCVPNPSWLGQSNIFHCGWRLRPDNLYAQGPLDTLVGMQYRIDHLENAKADAFDLIVHPVMKVKGFVEDFEYGPGERIFIGDEGDVEFMSPDVTMLQADTQIAMYEQKMEEFAGAPKQAMGFRTPGEKTAYEVQILENGANRIFINKTSYFEEMFIEPVLNAMLEIARRNMGASDLVRVMDNSNGVVNFMKITKEDITAKGKIRPVGARHFARNANMIQNLTQFASSAIGQDPSVNTHISGKRVAHLMEELLGMERYQLVQDNIRVAENLETQKLMQAASTILQTQGGPVNAQAAAGAPQQQPQQGKPTPNASPVGQPPQRPQR